MTTNKASSGALEDFRVPVKIKIAALWTAVMFCYVYGDIFVLQQPGHVKSIVDGTSWFGGPVTQGMLLAFAVSMALPSISIVLTLVLRPAISRWWNIGFGLFCTAFMIMTLLAPGVWYFYLFLGAVETILTLSIVWLAWKWPRQN